LLAIGAYLKKQNPDQISTGMYFLFTVIGVLAITVLIQSWLNKKRKSKLNKQRDEYQNSLDNMPVGMIKLNLEGSIVYANKQAATLLGRQHEKLINGAFIANFDTSDSPELAQSLFGANATVNIGDGVQAFAKSSKAYIRIQIAEPILEADQHLSTLILTNENKLQRSLTEASTHRDKLAQLMTKSELGQVTFDIKEDTCIHDAIFDQLLLIGDVKSKGDTSEAYAIDDFIKRIHNADKGDWTKALEKAKAGQANTVSLRMQLTTSGKSMVYVPLEVSIVPIMSGEAEHLETITLVVRENTSIEQEKATLDLVNHQQQALLNGSVHAMYCADESGNLLWSNSPFNQLLRRVVPEAHSKNLFELNPFPEDIMQLHQKPAGLSTRGYDMEFELSTHDGRLMWCRINIAFYTSKDRLSEQSNVGVVGILQDISELHDVKSGLEQEQSRMQNLLNLAPVAIATINNEDQIVSANNVMLERLQYSEKDLKKGNFYQLFSDPAQAGSAAKHLNQSGRLRDFHASLKGKDNKLHPSELHVDLINKDTQEYLCWIADRSDEQFQQDKFDSLLQHSSMPMAILAEKGFTQLNKPACDFFCVEDEYDLFGIAPYSTRLNNDPENAHMLEKTIEEVKRSGKAKSMHWLHKVGDHELPCQATYVPMYKDQAFDSILCIWMDKRELQKADEARMEAINLHQAAERQIQEKQKLLANSQDQLATKMRTLADTEQKLQNVQEDLNETQSEYSHLQQAHHDITQNLEQLKQQYSQSRVMLADAQRTNADLNAQLESSTEEVQGLNAQREEIANALLKSEENYKAAQKELAQSEENAANLTKQKEDQAAQLEQLGGQINEMKNAVNAKDEQISQVSEQINTLQSQLVSSSSATDKLKQQLINQRKASEEAEKQRRELEQTYQVAQAELRNKGRHLNHLQSEMEKLEEMSNQEKGDMQAQQSALKEELEHKLQQLQTTQTALSEAQAAAEQEKQEKAEQQARLARAENELAEMEASAQAKQQEMEEKERQRREQQKALQHKLWEELKTKQQKLKQTEDILSQAKQQTESEKAEKEAHQQVLEQLKSELKEIEARNEQQQAQAAQSDEAWNRSKQALKQEVEAKRVQLQQSKQAMQEIQAQADKERLSRIEQEQKLEQLTRELSDVETRANKQKEMLSGSDEQWRKHHAEIEQQKQQLQEALAQAETQNQSLQNKLEGKLSALQEAETQVNETQSGEHKLQQELEKARTQAEDLQRKISDQEHKEQKLNEQLIAQQQALESKESSIADLHGQQQALAEELAAVQKEYSESKATLSEQHDSHSHLNEQMSELEQSLQQSKQALADKEAALQGAQKELEVSKNKLAEQENALLSAHKEALEISNQEQNENSTKRPDIEKLPMPDKPAVWFDLLPYLQSQPNMASLPVALTELMDELQSLIEKTETALETNDIRAILSGSKALVALAGKINSDALSYLMQSIENDCNNGMADNVSIRWPATKQGLEKTLRVVYSHMHA
jgi:epidermal growth factor receptor substrate 15